MAVDEWLLETGDRPVLRVYRWLPDWASLGCFGNYEEACGRLSGVKWVRRFTGGGMVDHRDDWTYTLVIPNSEALARQKGAESYRLIHSALSRVLAENALLSAEDSGGPAGVCFLNPVKFDLVSETGEKLAGAGQRRTKSGLLHQGSVAGKCDSRERAERLAAALTDQWREISPSPPEQVIADKVSERYGSRAWTTRR
jgi:lipoate-protein ligase A